MSVRYLFDCLERKEELNHREDLRFGLLASLLFNPNRKKGTRATKPSEWFRKPRRREGPMNEKEADFLIQRVWKPYWQGVAKNRKEQIRYRHKERASA